MDSLERDLLPELEAGDDECVVCGEKEEFSVACAHCSYLACCGCVEQYLLTKSKTDCMNCHKEWSLQFVYNMLGHHFYNGAFNKHRRSLLVEREKSFMVETMEYARVFKIQLEIQELLKDAKEDQASMEKLQSLTGYMSDSQTRLYQELTGERIIVKEKKPRVSTFVLKCRGENCRGMVDQTWTCVFCKRKYCEDCEVELDIEGNKSHECDTDIITNVRTIRQDTKACPKCYVKIYKTEGCDQMWCTSCNTAFSWKSLEILSNTVIHNPHFYEYLRLNNIPFGDRYIHAGLINNGECFNLNQRTDTVFYDRRLDPILYLYNHIGEVELPLYRDHQTHDPRLNRDLRVRFLVNDLAESGFIYLVKKREKEREYKQEMYELFQSVRTILEGCLMEAQSKTDERLISAAIKEAVNIVKHFNEQAYEFLCYKYKYKSQKFIDLIHLTVRDCSKSDLAKTLENWKKLYDYPRSRNFITWHWYIINEEESEEVRMLNQVWRIT